LLLVSPPVHPAIARALGRTIPPGTRDLFSSLDTLPGVAWLDLTRLLAEDQFIDDVHASSEGALRLTRRIAEALEID
jgi:hypothetical protein